MATLTPRSAAAIARLRAYTAPPTAWGALPLTRRAAVLILLFADRRGELRVVLTMRANTLNNYAGQAAFPGGKADTLQETPFTTARREAYEEIGLPTSPTALPYPFAIEHLTQLPTNLAKTELGVAPCVAYLRATAPTDRTGRQVDAEAMLVPRLDAKEVAAVFSAPFYSFLRTEADASDVAAEKRRDTPARSWYEGNWIDWHEAAFRMHSFYVPSARSVVAKSSDSSTAGWNPASQRQEETSSHFRVWGMTARLLVDCARVAYGEEPQFEHNAHFGDEDLIRRLSGMGRMREKRPRGAEFRAGEIGSLVGKEGDGSGEEEHKMKGRL